MKSFFGSALLCASALLTPLCAQTFDTSANATLKGAYFVRQLLLSSVDATSGAIGRARSLLGTATLDGNGGYTLTGTLMDSTTGVSKAFNFSGTYKVSSNGLAQFQNPLEPAQIVDGGLGLGAFVGSSTETLFQDMLVLIPASSSTVSNSALTGSYRVGNLEFLQGSSTTVRDAYFTLTTAGDGNLGNVSVNGSAANLGNTNLTQTVTAATYTVSGQGSGSIIFPAGNAAATSLLVSGTKTLFVSADGNIIVGGSPNGFDLLLGIRAPTGPVNSGTFYVAGFDEDASVAASPVLDAFYGSVDSIASGVNLWHQRLNPINTQTYDFTFASQVSLDSTGALSKSLVHYDSGAGGKALLIVGRSTQYSLALALHADNFNGAGVFINPLGVVNAANFAPITNSVAPNEFISLFGLGLSSGIAQAASLPLQTTLGGVQVTVNGRLAPLFYVSPQQINVLVPSNTPEIFATIQVINNGVKSNLVTVYANDSAPGVFTLDTSGTGPAAALHADFSVVNAGNPAKPGEVILLFLGGLGAVTPAVADGAAGPPFSTVSKPVRVFFNGQEGAVSFSGLAPGFAGLYQINVQVPSSVSGSQLVTIDNPDAFHQEATLAVAASKTNSQSAAMQAGDFESYRPQLSIGVAPKTLRTEGTRR